MSTVYAKRSDLARYLLASPLKREFFHHLSGERSSAVESVIREFREGTEFIPETPSDFVGRSEHFRAGYLSRFQPRAELIGSISAAIARWRNGSFYDAARGA